MFPRLRLAAEIRLPKEHMAPLQLRKGRDARRLVQMLKECLSIEALKSLLIRRQGNAGRERYR
jgi:hypothetical protein